MERRTVQRTLILTTIRKLEHSTIPDILENCISVFPTISVGTIYRNLITLEKEGLIRRIPTKYKEDVYESTMNPVHDHFICEACNSICDIERKETLKPYINEFGDMVEEVSIVYYGKCSDCLKAKKC